MSKVRLRRLKSDYEAIRRLVHHHPYIAIEGVSGSPPDRYILLLNVRSLREQGEEIVYRNQHKLEIRLPAGYPRDAPMCRMLTPVFHPNIAPHAVCIGDHWSAAESLDLMIQRVGEMLAFQSYNVKSPLNGAAARWVEENEDKLPTQREEFFIDMTVAGEAETPRGSMPRSRMNQQSKCGNCGAAASDTCSKGHALCPDCRFHCTTCGRLQCLVCGEAKCPTCQPELASCTNCGQPGLVHCVEKHSLCADCAMQCPTCARIVCLACGHTSCQSCATA